MGGEGRVFVAFAVVFTSGKGGVGKTTLTALTARALESMGARVAAVDADFGLRNLDIALGVENSVVYDMGDVAAGRCDLSSALVKVQGNLYLLGASYQKGSVSKSGVRAIVDALKTAFDIVLLDSPAGIGSGFELAVAGADHAVVVTTPDGASVRDVERVAAILRQTGPRDVRLCVNRVVRRYMKRGLSPNVDEIIDAVSAKLVGIIPEDERLRVAMAAGGGIPGRKWASARAISEMAARIAGR